MKKAQDLRNLLFKSVLIGCLVNAINICTLPRVESIQFLLPIITLGIILVLYGFVTFLIWAKYEN